MAMFVLVWRSLGFPLSFKKAQRGACVTWIVAQYSIFQKTIKMQVKDAIIKDVRMMLDSLQGKNLIAIKDLRSLAGKLNAISSVVYTLRPFMFQFWAALSSTEILKSKAPKGMVWIKQIQISLKWVIAFMNGFKGSLVREFDLDSYLQKGRKIVVTLDASPFGIGAYLEIDDNVESWFAETITPTEAKNCMWTLASRHVSRQWKHLQS